MLNNPRTPATRRVGYLLPAAALLLALLSIGADDQGSTQNVTIQDMSFSPTSVHAKVGDTVIWTNADDQDHTVIAADGSFNSGDIGSGRSFQHKFTRAGTFGYYCKYHPRMKGNVVVAAKDR
ncbi:MAG TPA: cupredoxin family copper-binding protein [Tepidisphaeraceae bacterium]|nr:cupredoxin family copper-binding protein [Tepidisphaeraceae bacterium]